MQPLQFLPGGLQPQGLAPELQSFGSIFSSFTLYSSNSILAIILTTFV